MTVSGAGATGKPGGVDPAIFQSEGGTEHVYHPADFIEINLTGKEARWRRAELNGGIPVIKLPSKDTKEALDPQRVFLDFREGKVFVVDNGTGCDGDSCESSELKDVYGKSLGKAELELHPSGGKSNVYLGKNNEISIQRQGGELIITSYVDRQNPSSPAGKYYFDITDEGIVWNPDR